MTVNIDFTKALKSLTIKEIQGIVMRDNFSSGEKRSRSKLEEAAYLLPPDHRSLLVDAVLCKRKRMEDRARVIVVEPEPSIQPVPDNRFFETSTRMHIKFYRCYQF